MHSKAVFSWMIFVGFLCFPIEAAIIIDGYTPATNNRFSNSVSFIALQFDLSGIGQTSSGRWATLISPNVVVSANHFPPGAGAVINFYANNNPASAAVQRTVSVTPGKTVQVPNTDLWLGVLESNVPSSIRSYEYANTFLSGPSPNAQGFVTVNAGVFQNANAYMFGLAPGVEQALQSQAVGRNRISGYAENVASFPSTDNDSLLLDYDRPANANYVQFESHVVVNDSGAPLFIENNGNLLLLGTNAFQLSANGIVTGSGINYIGNQSAFISNFVSINAVPEPSSICLASMVFIAGYVANRRRKLGTHFVISEPL